MSRAEYHRIWYRKNRKKKNAQSRAWRNQNPKRYKFLSRRWYRKNRKKHIKRTAKNAQLRFKNPVARAKRKEYNSQRWLRKTKRQRQVAARHIARWLKAHPKKRRDGVLKCLYGISLKTFSELRKSQKNCCAICGRGFTKTPHVDHDHRSGRVRGLLCHQCNIGLGMFSDCANRLRGAIKYLTQ